MNDNSVKSSKQEKKMLIQKRLAKQLRLNLLKRKKLSREQEKKL